MKIHEFELENLPDTLSMDQIIRICHIGRLTARYYIRSGLIKNKNSGKKTRCYTVKREDFLKFVEAYNEDPSRFLPPPGWYKSEGHIKPKKRRKPVPRRAEAYCKTLYYTKILAEYSDLLNMEQVAEVTGYSSATLRRWCQTGDLKPIMTTPKYLFPKQFVMELLVSDFYENISTKSFIHLGHLHSIYREYTELRKIEEEDNEN